MSVSIKQTEEIITDSGFPLVFIDSMNFAEWFIRTFNEKFREKLIPARKLLNLVLEY